MIHTLRLGLHVSPFVADPFGLGARGPPVSARRAAHGRRRGWTGLDWPRPHPGPRPPDDLGSTPPTSGPLPSRCPRVHPAPDRGPRCRETSVAARQSSSPTPGWGARGLGGATGHFGRPGPGPHQGERAPSPAGPTALQPLAGRRLAGVGRGGSSARAEQSWKGRRVGVSPVLRPRRASRDRSDP